MLPATIGLYCSDPAEAEAACVWRAKYGFAELERPPENGYALVWELGRLQLQAFGPKAPGPVLVDWSAPAAKRRLQTSGRQQPLARACGFKPGRIPEVIDATAGLGQDAFVLAWLGARVRCFERSPVAAALLEDGLRRAAAFEPMQAAAARMRLESGDARRVLPALPPDARPDTVYLDPMYPDSGRTALSGKNMQAFQACIGADADADELLHAALAAARQRVVVKRPRKARFLAGQEPFTQIVGESTRYDIYMVHGREPG